MDIKYVMTVGAFVADGYISHLKQYCFLNGYELDLQVMRKGFLQSVFGVKITLPEDADVVQVLKDLKVDEEC